MKALLLVAHGSRRQASNDEVVELAENLRKNSSLAYDIIHHAFLELAEPSIQVGIQACIDDDATSVVILPYFLNSGRHVTEDIPKIVNHARTLYPDKEIKISPHIGASGLMMGLLIDSANSAA